MSWIRIRCLYWSGLFIAQARDYDFAHPCRIIWRLAVEYGSMPCAVPSRSHFCDMTLENGNGKQQVCKAVELRAPRALQSILVRVHVLVSMVMARSTFKGSNLSTTDQHEINGESTFGVHPVGQQLWFSGRRNLQWYLSQCYIPTVVFLLLEGVSRMLLQRRPWT